MKTFFLKTISFVLHPLLIPTYAICLLLWSNYPYSSYIPLSAKFLLLQYTVVGTVILPIIIFSVLYVKRNTSSVSAEKQEEQLFVSASYIIFLTLLNILFYKTHILNEIKLIPFLSLVLSIFVVFINLKFKISAHVVAIAAITGFILCLTLRYSLYLFVPTITSIIASGLVCYEQIESKKNTLKEVGLGYLTGFFVSGTMSIISLW